MLGDVLCERPKHWFLNSYFSTGHYGSVAHRRYVSGDCFPIKLVAPTTDCVDRRCIANGLNFCESGASSSLWHSILPAGIDRRRHNLTPVGEGSWNVAWDVRPARWLHRPHTAWLLFSLCAYLAAPAAELPEPVVANDNDINGTCSTAVLDNSANYRVTGVPADGRCLFRAIAHMVCLRNGEEAPDENRQKELADELRVQVVDELMKRRKETEWFIEGDFDVYVKRIQKPFVWGGEPELLMASHVLKTTISVYMYEKGSKNLSKIATYGEDYKQAENSSIKVLFHGYGHYDILEDIQNKQ